jgi:hypothetical protein
MKRTFSWIILVQSFYTAEYLHIVACLTCRNEDLLEGETGLSEKYPIAYEAVNVKNLNS